MEKGNLVKKLFILLMFGLVGIWAIYFNMACTTKSPSAPNLQSPLQTIVAINPTWTFTPTATNSPTITAVHYMTPTPFVTTTWNGFSNPQAIFFSNNNVN